jgi:enoyl-CoA hydratase/carnithine racemase
MALVEIEDRGSVRHLVLSRPEKRNALNVDLYRELGAATTAAAAAADVRAVVVRGAGPDFCAGNDVAELAALPGDPSSVRRVRPMMLAAFNALEEMPKPTIAQVHGRCYGSGFELMLACDLRVLATDVSAGLRETALGLVPDLGGCSRLPAIVGLGRAKDLILTARLIDTQEAWRIGLADRVAPPDQLDAATQALCDELLRNSSPALGLAKRVLDAAAKPGLTATLELEVTAQELLAGGPDLAERAAAVVNRSRA